MKSLYYINIKTKTGSVTFATFGRTLDEAKESLSSLGTDAIYISGPYPLGKDWQ